MITTRISLLSLILRVFGRARTSARTLARVEYTVCVNTIGNLCIRALKYMIQYDCMSEVCAVRSARYNVSHTKEKSNKEIA